MPELGTGLPGIPGLPWESLSHRQVLAELATEGWVPCGVADWAVALRSPAGTVVARVCPFDPAYAAFVDLCRECAGNRWLPGMELAADPEYVAEVKCVRSAIGVIQDDRVATLFLIVGLPGAGKTTRAKELAAQHRALRLTPDEWMIPLFGDSMADGKRFVLEGRLISVALQVLRLGTSVVLDFGLWGRDERSALRWLARSAGASSRVVYLPVDKDVQLARIAHRQETAPHRTFPMTGADVDAWREQFQVPDAAELDGGEIPGPPAGWPGWPEWASDHWPSLADG